MNIQAEELNKTLQEVNPALFDMLSERGKAIFFPKKGILGQSAEAKGTTINATIGAAIEDDNSPMRLKSISKNLNIDASKAFPYAPSFGRPDIRARWKEMIYQKNPALGTAPISLPIVTNALTHGISMAGYMFANPGDEVLVPSLFWGNYNLTFINAYNAKIEPYNLFKDNGLDIEAMSAELMSEGDKKILLLNFPNNPTGYSPTVNEMKEIVASVEKAANAGKKVVVICDDAYFGLVFEEGIETQSPFAWLANLHENVLAVKVDGPTKEDYVWGFRVGFITYGIKGGTEELYSALENKTAGAVRGNISNASNLSQSLLLEAFDSPTYKEEKKEKFDILNSRYKAVKEVLKDPKYAEFFKPLPYNSGYFMCVELKEGIDANNVRQLLIEKYSIGVISLNNLLRLAFSAVAAKDVPTLFEGIHSACKELANR
ncbi:aminotransferase class I/II-fold pyridoxal phosphate-dependent enzyme [Alkalitalea saponilacus]|uniref:Aspartate/methionine/tyrosine aminotransferase n=1 Tax=Alkalitalea saponilacus TaxID=889453 RepID=A0A1T5HK84_9BACT|nr:aminotransferase class I/II-fold pyridoxal phosphate-dependent enzyme [Alkalitalea saponilacus]ASB47765.1 aspartate aminotransferase [Alkalitalea saponilacus]SKC21105.1 Aspartate/methionine/tyrosine aminotransferase [Alkalitalea saponilacus]